MASAITGLVGSTRALSYPFSSNAIKIYADPEAYQVYAAAVRENLAYREATSTVMIREGTIADSPALTKDCLHPGPKYQNLVNPALADYQQLNRSRWKLARLFPIDKPYQLVSETEFAGRFWKLSSDLGEYMRQHQNNPGIVELSAIGFNPARTIAVIRMNYNCGPMCRGSSGDLLVLQKQGGQWKPLIGRRLRCFWIS